MKKQKRELERERERVQAMKRERKKENKITKNIPGPEIYIQVFGINLISP